MEEQRNIGPNPNSKNYRVFCNFCNWSRVTTGISSDLKDLHYIKPTCMSCGKPREYRCPKCGKNAKMKKIKRNV